MACSTVRGSEAASAIARNYRLQGHRFRRPPATCVIRSGTERHPGVTGDPGLRRYTGDLAEDLARSHAHADHPDPLLPSPRRIPGGVVRLRIPYRNRWYRAVRLVGMASLLGSALGLLAAVAGLGLNLLSMLGALGLSLVLIGITVRPSLRRPRF